MCGSNACIANPSWIPGARLQTFFMGVVRAWGLSAKRLFDEKGKQLTFTKTYDHTNTDIQHPAPQK
jgi:hypothetical protein